MMMQGQRFSFWYWLLLIIWSALIVVLLYESALSLPFFFDDFVHYPFVEANNIADIWLTTGELAYYRPLNFTIWRLTYETYGAHPPVVDHAINLALHALNGVLVGWLAAFLWPRSPAAETGGAAALGPAAVDPDVAQGEAEDAEAEDEDGEEDPPADAGELASAPAPVAVDVVPDWWRAFISATLFLAFPFSYQAVPWVGSLSHILVTTLILLSVASYLQMRRSGSRLWAVPSLFFAILAPFAHENGLLIMPFVVLVELTTPQRSNRSRRALRAALLWAVPWLIYLPIWLSLPRVETGRLFANNAEGILQNSVYFLQGLFYPFTGLGGWLRSQVELNDMVTVLLLSGFGAAFALLVQWRYRATRRSLLPWLWYLVGSLPAVLFLVFEYVINGPRLLMVAGVGAAWLWTDVALLLARGRPERVRFRRLRTAFAAALILALLFYNVTFIRDRMELHVALGEGLNQVLEATRVSNERDQRAVIVNFPSWFASRRHVFPLGHEGVLFWPDYVPAGILSAVHTGNFGDIAFVRADAIRPDLEEVYYGLTGPAADWGRLVENPAEVWLTTYQNTDVELVPVGQLGLAAEEVDTNLLTLFRQDGATATLLTAAAAETEDGVRVDLFWRVPRPLEDATVFVHLLDEQGQLVAQADGEPLGGSYPLSQWQGINIVRDTRWIETEPGVVPFAVRVGLYNRATGERLGARTPDGAQWLDDAVSVPLHRP